MENENSSFVIKFKFTKKMYRFYFIIYMNCHTYFFYTARMLEKFSEQIKL